MSNFADISNHEIEAFVDNQLDYQGEKRVLSALEKDLSARDQYRRIFKQKLLLKKWWKSQEAEASFANM